MTIHDPSPRPRFEASLDARILYDRLSKAEVGDTLTYKELSDLIGRDVANGARGVLNTARRMAIREDRIVFGVITAEGLIRLGDSDIVAAQETQISRVRRLSRRALRSLACAKFENLDNDKRVEFNTRMAHLGTLAALSSGRAIKRIEAKVRETGQPVALNATLELFKK
jgi:hypothetical protein